MCMCRIVVAAANKSFTAKLVRWRETVYLAMPTIDRRIIGRIISLQRPVYLQCDEETAETFIQGLREQFGIFCSVVVYPVIPIGQMILRLITTVLHDEKDIEETLNAFAILQQELAINPQSRLTV